MKILIIILFITLLFCNNKEGFFWKKRRKKQNKQPPPRWNPGPNWNKICNDSYSRRRKQNFYTKYMCTNRWKQRKANERIEKQKKECSIRLNSYNFYARQRSMWEQKKRDLERTYKDRNFGNQRISGFFKDDIDILNANINENTKLNNDLNKILKKIKIYQNINYPMIDILKKQNTALKECKMNKELTDNDYDILN